MKIAKFLSTSPIWAAYRLHERLVVPMQKTLKESDITYLQSLMLAAIYFEETSVSPSELVQLFGTSMANMSHSLKHLRMLGLVERTIDERDARRTRFLLTPRAASSLAHIIDLHHSAQEAFEARLSTEAVAEWCNVASRISGLDLCSRMD